MEALRSIERNYFTAFLKNLLPTQASCPILVFAGITARLKFVVGRMQPRLTVGRTTRTIEDTYTDTPEPYVRPLSYAGTLDFPCLICRPDLYPSLSSGWCEGMCT